MEDTTTDQHKYSINPKKIGAYCGPSWQIDVAVLPLLVRMIIQSC